LSHGLFGIVAAVTSVATQKNYKLQIQELLLSLDFCPTFYQEKVGAKSSTEFFKND